MQRLILATRNAHKTREFRQLFGDVAQVDDLTDAPGLAEVEESGTTFGENAALKALAASAQFPHALCLGDDSGLEVDALGGAPGIFSARYAAPNATDESNVEKLLRELAALPPSLDPNAARFCCALALARAGAIIFVAEGIVKGTIAPAQRGTGGFGYDPVFVPAGFNQTFAELPAATKNELSHRARAAAMLKTFLLGS